MLNVICTQEHLIHTGRGSVSVAVFGDQEKPALITYPDLALNRKCSANFSGSHEKLSSKYVVLSLFNFCFL